MKPEFDEAEFGSAVVREIVWERKLGPARIPEVLLSAPEEEYWGVDVLIALGRRRVVPLFLQFKRSDCLTRRPATYWDFFGCQQYFRFDVYPANIRPQHNDLRELNSHFSRVYYAAPAFYCHSDYVRLSRSVEVIDNTALISPGSLEPNTEDEEHSVCFTLTPWKVRWCSEEGDGDGFAGGKALREDIGRKRDYRPPQEVLEDLERFLDLPRKDQSNKRAARHVIDRFREAAHEVSTKYGARLIVVPEEDG